MKVVESFESVGNCKIYTRSVGQGPDVVDAGSNTQIVQHLASGASHLQLHVCSAEFGANSRHAKRDKVIE